VAYYDFKKALSLNEFNGDLFDLWKIDLQKNSRENPKMNWNLVCRIGIENVFHCLQT